VIGRAELCEHVWDANHDPFSNAIEVYINRLRKKVDESGGTPLIHTRRGAGYLLAAEEEDRGGVTGARTTTARRDEEQRP
jgi:two-component system copper resistance phosphate regulon response regulator CusR